MYKLFTTVVMIGFAFATLGKMIEVKETLEGAE